MLHMMKRVTIIAACCAVLTSCQQIDFQDETDHATAAGHMAARPVNYVALPGQAATASETATAIDSAAAAYTQAAQQPQMTFANTAAPLRAPVEKEVSPSSNAPYALQIMNGTQNRLFIEAQDESGNIFPFGFMYAGQRVGTQPQEPRLISGNLIIVLRDPDRNNAPEIRRYVIPPPLGYEGRTLCITILPGGRYRVTIDGVVQFASPEPVAAPAA